MTAAAADPLLGLALRSLDLLAERGDATARHARAVLLGRRSLGRPPVDDSALLAEVMSLRAAGRGREAVGIVARRHAADAREIAAIERRLRRKLNGHKSICPRSLRVNHRA